MAGFEATAHVEIAATPEVVWTAMTDPDRVAKYMMGSRVETDWVPGSAITWSGEWEGRPYQDKGRVIAAEPGRRLEVTHYSPLSGGDDVPDNYHTLRYELTADGSTTALTLTQDGCASQKQADGFSENWQSMLEGLKEVAES